MIALQKEIILPPFNRGFHLITDLVVNEIPMLKTINIGTANFFIKHTSASLTLNENADPDVRRDLETFFNKLTPDGASYFIHQDEGPDDMPAHVKSSLLGNSITIPITNGKLNLGTWQGLYLCEHRNYGGRRKLVITLLGSG